MTVPAAEAAKSYAKNRAQKTGRQAREIGVPGGSRYQTAVLAEFLVAALVVAFAPLASPPKDEKGGPSPYRVGDLGQLAALGIVYFLLAVWSSTGKGRSAAWAGFLVLLGVLFRKTVNGQLVAEVKPLAGKPQAEAEGDKGAPPA